jgi:tripartite-type tricarboxylate transporter receptor subunit TctC
VVQFALRRDPNMSDIPTVVELSDDPEVRRIFANLVSNDEVGRSLFTTPNVPPARLALLRGAFQRMLADAEFRAEAEKLNLPLATRTGEELQQLVRDTLDVPAATLAKLRELVK